MSRKTSKLLSVLAYGIVVLLSLATSVNNATASIRDSANALNLTAATCANGLEQYQELTQLRTAITAAATLEQAREMALAPTASAIDAVHNARTLMPFSEELLTAESNLSTMRTHILLASSQEQVADKFSGMLLAGLDNDRAAHVKVGKVGGNYSSGELIAIVLGLILGIIPGLILLIVLC